VYPSSTHPSSTHPGSPHPIGARLSSPHPRTLPDARERLLLRAALLEGAPARSSWDAWRRAGGSIHDVGLASFRLLPLVYRTLESAGIDDPDLPVLKGVYRHAFVCNQRLVASVGPSLDALRAAGIETMVLKGAAAGAVHYRDMGARPMDDVDLLVRPQDAERALAVLCAQGWSALPRLDAQRMMRSQHALPLANADGGHIDLHWRALPESVRDDDFWAAAVPTALGTATTLAPGPADQLMHTCAHGVKFGGAPLRWIADAAMILRSAGGHLDWPRLVAAVTEREVSLRTATCLSLLRDLLGAPIPGDVLAELDQLRTGRRERLLLALARQPVLGGNWVVMWDRYRRRVAAGEDGYAYHDFLEYVADVYHLPSRAAIAPQLVRRAISLARPGRPTRDTAMTPPTRPRAVIPARIAGDNVPPREGRAA
jgi:hypothetical protein